LVHDTTRMHGDVALFGTTWEIKKARPERAMVACNPEKVRLTLEEPDLILRSKQFTTTYLYVRKFHEYSLPGGHLISSATRPLELVVVVDAQHHVIRTIYPAKPGTAQHKGVVTWRR